MIRSFFPQRRGEERSEDGGRKLDEYCHLRGQAEDRNLPSKGWKVRMGSCQSQKFRERLSAVSVASSAVEDEGAEKART